MSSFAGRRTNTERPLKRLRRYIQSAFAGHWQTRLHDRFRPPPTTFLRGFQFNRTQVILSKRVQCKIEEQTWRNIPDEIFEGIVEFGEFYQLEKVSFPRLDRWGTKRKRAAFGWSRGESQEWPIFWSFSCILPDPDNWKISVQISIRWCNHQREGS